MRNTFALSLLFFSIIRSVCIVCASNEYFDKGRVYAGLDVGVSSENILSEISLFGEISDQTLKTGLSFSESESFDDTFTGGNLDLHFNLGTRFSPYIGAGIFAGYSRERVPADNDNIDNDDDDFTDEKGEEKTIVDDVIASVYPEAGFYFWVTDNVKLSFSGKYHVTTEGRDYDFWIFSSGFNFSFY